MKLQRIAGRLGLAALVALFGFLLLVTVRMADAAYATQRNGGAARAAAQGTAASASAAWRQVLFFDHAVAPQAVLGEGWSTAAAGSGVWSRAPRAVLHLPPPPVGGEADVALTLEAFVVPARPFQRVTARIGAQTVGEWRLTSAGITTVHFQVPAALRDPAGGFELMLDLPNAGSPAKLVEGSMDARTLAIKLRRITIIG